MSTAELEFRKSLTDVLDDEFNCISEHWNTVNQSNRSLEDLLILPTQEHHEYQFSSSAFKHFTSNIGATGSPCSPAGSFLMLPSLNVSSAPSVEDTRSIFSEGTATENIFSKYADPTLTTTHPNSSQHQEQQHRYHSAASLQQRLQKQSKSQIQLEKNSKFLSIKHTQQSPIEKNTKNEDDTPLQSQQLSPQLPHVHQVLNGNFMMISRNNTSTTPLPLTVSLNNVMNIDNSLVHKVASTRTHNMAPTSSVITAGAPNYSQISPSKYNLIEDHQTIIADQQELDLLDDEDYIRKYYMEENGQKLNYFWSLQDNFNSSKINTHDPMQQLFDQDFDDDFSDDDDTNSFELLREDYDNSNDQGDYDSQNFNYTRKIGSNSLSYMRPLLNIESFVDSDIAIDVSKSSVEEDDDDSSVFDEDAIFDLAGNRKTNKVLSANQLSKGSQPFISRFLTPSSSSPSTEPVVPIRMGDPAMLVSVPIQIHKANRGITKTDGSSALTSSAQLDNRITNSATSITTFNSTKTKKRVISARQRSNDAVASPHFDKRATSPAPNGTNRYNTSNDTTESNSDTHSIADIDSSKADSPVTANSKLHQPQYNYQSTLYNEVNEEHTCQLINSITKQLCLKKFSRSYDLIRHQKTIHAAKKKIFRCLICIQEHGTEGYQRTFSRGDALSRHVKVKHELIGEEAQRVIQFAKENVEYVEA